MTDYLSLFKEWVVTLGEKHGVNPMLLGCLYLGSKVCFFSTLGYVIKNLRAKKPVIFPLLFAFTFFSIPYVYLIIAGRNISVWVYIFIAFVFLYGIFSIWKKLTAKPVTPPEDLPGDVL
jgi:membrane protein insertase Oxa1/YidC/SpoIIIJ